MVQLLVKADGWNEHLVNTIEDVSLHFELAEILNPTLLHLNHTLQEVKPRKYPWDMEGNK